MTEIDEISARLTVLETVVRQLITHMAVRAEDPRGWVATRKTLATTALNAEGMRPLEQVTQLRDAMADFFDQAELVVKEYR
jgi:hypothetical protein